MALANKINDCGVMDALDYAGTSRIQANVYDKPLNKHFFKHCILKSSENVAEMDVAVAVPMPRFRVAASVQQCF